MSELRDDHEAVQARLRADAVLLADASAEGAAIGAALRGRGFEVIAAPIADIEARLASDAPRVVIVDIDQPGSIEALERLYQRPGGVAASVLLVGDPIRSAELDPQLFGQVFERPVDIAELAAHVSAVAEPGRFRLDHAAAAAHLQAGYPGPIDNEVPSNPDFARDLDPLDVGSVLPPPEDGETIGPRLMPARISPELEEILVAAEQRVTAKARPSSIPAAEEDVDLMLSPELLSALDEPLDLDEEGPRTGASAGHAQLAAGSASQPRTSDPPHGAAAAPQQAPTRAETTGPGDPIGELAEPGEEHEDDHHAEPSRDAGHATKRTGPELAAYSSGREAHLPGRDEPARRGGGRDVAPPTPRDAGRPHGFGSPPPHVEAVWGRSPAPSPAPRDEPSWDRGLGSVREELDWVRVPSGRVEPSFPQRYTEPPPTRARDGRDARDARDGRDARDARDGRDARDARAPGFPPPPPPPAPPGYPFVSPPSVEVRTALLPPGDGAEPEPLPPAPLPVRSAASARVPVPPAPATVGTGSLGRGLLPQTPPAASSAFGRAPVAAPASVAISGVAGRGPAAPAPTPPMAMPPMPTPPMAMPPMAMPPVPSAPATISTGAFGRAPPPPPDDEAPVSSDASSTTVLGPGDAPRALARAVGSRASGALAIATEEGARRIVLHDGDIVTAGSSLPEETLLAFLVGRGDIERDVAVRLAGKLPASGRHAGAALIAHGHLGQDDLWPVLRAHAEWVIGHVVLVEAGTCDLEAEPPGRLKAEPNVFGGATGAEVFVETIRRVIAPEVALRRLGGPGARLDDGVRRNLLGECALRREEEELVRTARGRAVGELVSSAEPENASVIYALVCLEVLDVLIPPSVTEAPPPPVDDPLDEEAIRQRVRARLALVEDGDYFSILGIPRDATNYEIRRAYLALRKAFEPSTLLTAATVDLLDDVRLVIEVLDEAYEILREPHRRERYRRAIEAGPP
ncbi:DUF4388 domain-containing protein [Sorangium sp. So ce406]|uniref:DUF4388 domain-containing protein n=1 Tax=Sorangium sp. So ce406 TaxID=3133311 RepID=UPI003F5AEB67